MPELLRVSVKQLRMAHACPRQWFYHYMLGVPQVQGPALIEGNQLHAQMEAYLKNAPPPFAPESRIGKMARALMKYAEPRSQKAESEIVKLVKLPEYGIVVDLRCDFLDHYPPGRDLAIFKDWKTTGAPCKTAKLQNGKPWALQTLEHDWQARVYAFLLMHSHWKVPEVDAEWCFVSKKFEDGKTPKTWSVPHHFEYHETKAWFETYVVPTVALIQDMRAATGLQGNDIPHNPKSCEYSAHFCDVGGSCGVLLHPSPICQYGDLHLPVFPAQK